MDRNSFLTGLAIAVSWAAVGVTLAVTGDGAWIAVFAFLTAGSVANSRDDTTAGLFAILGWVAATVLMVVLDGSYWIAVFAFVASTLHFGLFGIPRPARIEWDFRSDDHSASVR